MTQVNGLTEGSRKRVDDFVRENGVMYTLAETAAILGRSQRTVMNYVKDGLIEGTRIGGRWSFRKESINKFLKGGK